MLLSHIWLDLILVLPSTGISSPVSIQSMTGSTSSSTPFPCSPCLSPNCLSSTGSVSLGLINTDGTVRASVTCLMSGWPHVSALWSSAQEDLLCTWGWHAEPFNDFPWHFYEKGSVGFHWVLRCFERPKNLLCITFYDALCITSGKYTSGFVSPADCSRCYCM